MNARPWVFSVRRHLKTKPGGKMIKPKGKHGGVTRGVGLRMCGLTGGSFTCRE